jgi:hypothetical protein
MTDAVKTCDVCKGKSGGTYAGVASVPGAPVSIAWCNLCIGRDAIPDWIADHDFIFVAQGDLARLSEWARARTVWADDRYMSFEDYVKRITPQMVEEQWQQWERAISPDEEKKDG